MIDLHCHILPEVDDGPKSLDEALEAVQYAYNHGTRTIIATPHVFHPQGFNSQHNAVQIFESLKAMVATQIPQMKLLLGAEVYFGPEYRERILHLDDCKEPLTLNGSRYMLVEFDRQVLLHDVLEILHELKVRGYVAIVAHLEMYTNLIKDLNAAQEIKKAGGLIQITASSIANTQNTNLFNYTREILLAGLIDFIASDGHGMRYRRPYLDAAYQKVQKMSNKATAEALFAANAAIVIENANFPSQHFKSATQISKVKNKQFVVAIGTLALSMALIAMTAIGATSYQDEIADKLSGDTAIKVVEPVTNSKNNVPLATVAGSLMTQTSQAEQTTVDVTNNLVTVDNLKSIESEYYNNLVALETYYKSEVDRIANEIEVTRRVVTDKEKQKKIINAYIDEAGNLEDKVDIQVTSILYKMQNELEDHQLPIDAVKSYRKKFHDTKAETKNRYIDQVRNQ